MGCLNSVSKVKIRIVRVVKNVLSSIIIIIIVIYVFQLMYAETIYASISSMNHVSGTFEYRSEGIVSLMQLLQSSFSA